MAGQGVQDGMYELHQLMIDAGVSVYFLSGSQPGAAHIALLNLHKIFGRSLLKWIRDIGYVWGANPAPTGCPVHPSIRLSIAMAAMPLPALPAASYAMRR